VTLNRLGSSPLASALRPWPWSRERAAVLGLILAVLGLSHRIAFVVTRSGAAALIAGVAILAAVALVRNWPGPRSSTEELNLLLTATLMLFAVVGALRPYKYDLIASALTLLAALAFILLEPLKPLRRYRLWVVTPLLLAAHVALLLHFNLPKQDVYRFLTFGVDGLFHHGINPYLPIHPTCRSTTRSPAMSCRTPSRTRQGRCCWSRRSVSCWGTSGGPTSSRRAFSWPRWR